MRLSGHQVICAGIAEIVQSRNCGPWRLRAVCLWEPCKGGFIVERKLIQ